MDGDTLPEKSLPDGNEAKSQVPKTTRSSCKKKKWFTHKEKLLLKQLVKMNSSVINTGRKKGVSVQEKKRVWQSIAEVFNSHPDTVTVRTVIELRRCWDCMKFYAKKKLEGKTADDSVVAERELHVDTDGSVGLVGTAPLCDDQFKLQNDILAQIFGRQDTSPEAHGVHTNVSQSDKVPLITQETTDTTSNHGDHSYHPHKDFLKPLSGSIGQELGDIKIENINLKRELLKQELLLIEEQRKVYEEAHLETLRMLREEHEAKINFMKQDFFLKKILFRVQACQYQPCT